MNTNRIAYLFLVLFSTLLSAPRLSAQFGGGPVLADNEMLNRAWHIVSKKNSFPLMKEEAGDVKVVDDIPLDRYSIFVFEHRQDDGHWWTADKKWMRIRSYSTNKYLTVQDFIQGNSGARYVGLDTSLGNDAYSQQFEIVPSPAGSGWYKIRCRMSQNGPDLVLGISDFGDVYAGQPDIDPAPEQKFAFDLALPDTDPAVRYIIMGIHNNDFLSDRGISGNGAPVKHVEDMDYSVHWNFQNAGDGYYYLMNSLTGNFLTNNGSTEAGDALYMTTTPDENAKWEVIRDDHVFKIKNKESGYYLGTKGQTADGQPVYQTVGTAVGIRWMVAQAESLNIDAKDQDFDKMLDNPTPYNTCLVFGPQFMQAVAERVGLPADASYFPLLSAALAAQLGSVDQANHALQNFDLNNPGHRVELAYALRQYLLGNVAQRDPSTWSPIEAQAITVFQNKVNALRSDYSDRLQTAWDQFSVDFGLNNGGDFVFSDFLDNLDAGDFQWPGQYEADSYQAALMRDYFMAAKDFNLNNSQLSLSIIGFEQSLTLPGLAAGVNAAITAHLLEAATAIADGLQFSTKPAIVAGIVIANSATQSTAGLGAAALASAGTVVTVALLAVQIIAMEAMQAVEVQRLNNKVDEKIAWGHQAVDFHAIMTSNDELAKIRLVQDMDYLIGAPVSVGFQHNTVDNANQTSFTLSCLNSVTVSLGANGSATLLPAQIGSVTLFCGDAVNYTLSRTNFNCSDLGAQSATLTATNSYMSANCSPSIQVVDNIAPTVVCKNFTTQLNAAGAATVSTANVLQSSGDNCGVVNLQPLSQTAFNCSNLGANTVTLSVNDGHGNTANCTSTVTVVDNIAPTVVCKNKTVFLNATGTATLATADVFQSGADNCGTVNQQAVSPNTFSCANLGTSTSTLTVNDGHGNTATCTATVTVADNLAPTVVCQNKPVFLNAAGTASISTADVFQSGSDNCGTVNQQSVVPNAFSCSNLGANTVTLSANDGHGNTGTCSATVTVADNINPTVLCKNLTINLNAAGTATVTATQINNGSFDNCSIASMSLNPATFTCANLGANAVQLEGIDQSGNKGQCSTTVTVIDATAPIALCKNATVQLNTAGTVTVSPSTVNNGSTDACGIAIMTLTPNTFNCANVGANTATFKATDASGNSTSCQATITVQDKANPVAACKNITVNLDGNGHVNITPAQVNNGSSDACGIATMTINNNAFDCANISAAVTVTLTVKDVNNNTSTCQSQVTVKDNQAPTAVCDNTTVVLGPQGTVSVPTTPLAGNSYDNCAVWSYSPTAKVYTSANLGVNNLNITVKDWSNNAATCVSQVTVLPFGSSLVGHSRHDSDQASPSLAEDRAATGEMEIKLVLTPNPTAGDATVQFQLPADQPFNLRLFDNNGRLILNQTLQGVAGENRVPLQIGRFPASWYTVEVESGGRRAQKRLVIQRA